MCSTGSVFFLLLNETPISPAKRAESVKKSRVPSGRIPTHDLFTRLAVGNSNTEQLPKIQQLSKQESSFRLPETVVCPNVAASSLISCLVFVDI